MKRTLFVMLALAGAVALAAVSTAGGSATQRGKGRPSMSATPVFKLLLKPSQEVPRIQGLRANAVGHVTFDLTRNASGAITAGEVIFYFNYAFPSSVTISGLHVHVGARGTAPPNNVVVDSGISSFTDADGHGNITTVVAGTPATLQAILDNPRNYYVNLHTTTPPHPTGALRAQLHNPKKR